MSAAAEWQSEGASGVLRCGPLTGRAEADGRGVRFLPTTWNGMPSDAFGAMITAGPGPRPAVIAVKERYVRGCDFVATYAQSDDYPVVPHFYWRAAWLPARAAVHVQMIVSVQTDLLDSQPETSVSSFGLESQVFLASALRASAFAEVTASRSLPAGDSREQLVLFRCAALGLSYAQLVHPTDFVAADLQVEAGRPALVSSTLFPESLEKGVIRRARIGGWFLPAENDLAAAVELAKQFVAEPLPLTT